MDTILNFAFTYHMFNILIVWSVLTLTPVGLFFVAVKLRSTNFMVVSFVLMVIARVAYLLYVVWVLSTWVTSHTDYWGTLVAVVSTVLAFIPLRVQFNSR